MRDVSHLIQKASFVPLGCGYDSTTLFLLIFLIYIYTYFLVHILTIYCAVLLLLSYCCNNAIFATVGQIKISFQLSILEMKKIFAPFS